MIRSGPATIAASVSALALMLAGCAKGELDETGGLRITRSTCPAVAIPAYTGDVTLFSPPQSQDARALDVVATMSDLRSTCDETGAIVKASATFQVSARRANPQGTRDIVLPYFATVLRGGTKIMSKQESRVALHFADGQARATATATAGAQVDRAMASLPADISQKLNRRRKASDTDAAVDPMSDPRTRAIVNQSNFELLVGFQLTQAQLAYNATR